jgi:hypothetical protein
MKIVLTLMLIFTSTAFAANVALFKPAEATAEYSSSNLAMYAVDGDLDTRWNAGTYAPPVQSLTVDLLNIYPVYKIDLWSEIAGSFPGNYVNYDLFTSTDKLSWQFISSGTLIDTLDPHKEAVFSPMPVRYVRYDVTDGTHWAHLNEMEVYDIPEPTTLLLFGLGGLAMMRRQRA